MECVPPVKSLNYRLCICICNYAIHGAIWTLFAGPQCLLTSFLGALADLRCNPFRRPAPEGFAWFSQGVLLELQIFGWNLSCFARGLDEGAFHVDQVCHLLMPLCTKNLSGIDTASRYVQILSEMIAGIRTKTFHVAKLSSADHASTVGGETGRTEEWRRVDPTSRYEARGPVNQFSHEENKGVHVEKPVFSAIGKTRFLDGPCGAPGNIVYHSQWLHRTIWPTWLVVGGVHVGPKKTHMERLDVSRSVFRK